MMTTNHDVAIEADGLVKTYPKDVRALDGLGFRVRAGTVFGLLGPNGAGKSTTVRILTTLARADEGNAVVAGHDVGRSPTEVRRRIGVVSQRASADPEATGRENLLLQGRAFGIRGRALTARVADLLERFGLSEAADRIVRTYSGGMQRRLEVALGLVHRPEVLFLDEPTTGLDPEVRAAMWDEVTSLARDDGLTILLTTHYLEEADRLADRLAIVHRGRVAVEGTPTELKRELAGDALHLELDGDAGSARDLLAGGLARDVATTGRAIRARVDDGATALPAVLQHLERGGFRVTSATISRPSLDDVYLRYTGHVFDEAPEERTEVPA
jgi:ABC-2 type transport system ATP-binding protein